jgi:hypothetical protein
MSTHIIDRMEAVKVPPEKEGQETLYVLATLGGDNNVIEYATNRRARDWSVLAVGSQGQVMRRAIIMSASMEGGSMRIYGRKEATAETFIRMARSRLHNAPRFDSPEAAFRLCNTRITFSLDEVHTNRFCYEKLEKLGIQTHDELRKYSNQPVTAFPFNVGTLEGMRSFIEHLPHVCSYWHHMDIVQTAF